MDKIRKKALELMKNGYICDNCLGRGFAELLTGMSNDERGKIVRYYVAFLIDSGEDIDIDDSNMHGIKFRNSKIAPKKPEKCVICENFFLEKIDRLAEKIAEKLSGYDFETFLVGTKIPGYLVRNQEKSWMKAGIEFVEPLKREINREIGKRLEKLTGKEADIGDPDITVIVDLNTDRVTLQVKSIFLYGRYSKYVRGIPQSKWICKSCGGKGCRKCDGIGKLYETSIQEIVEKPLIKEFKAKRSKFHGSGREDVDVRCLGKRPFIIELLRPKIRKSSLKKIQSDINKSKKIDVFGLKYASKDDIDKVKHAKYDKTYSAEVLFEDKIEDSKIGTLKKLKGEIILQRTPNRVSHRRADKVRKRILKKIKYEKIGDKKARFEIKGEAGLYIKELITGDEGRTNPNFSDVLDNKVKSIKLDVIKIHTRRKAK